MKKIIICLLCILLLSGCDKTFKLNEELYDGGEFIKITADDLENITGNYVVYVYSGFCSFKIPCDQIFKKVMEKYNVSFYSMSIKEMEKTFLSKKVTYAPSLIVVKDGKIVDFLDANDDDDLVYYQDANYFEEWIQQYVILNK